MDIDTETPEIRVFQISTLRDIFNLPTIEQMQTCLHELSEGMLQARVASDTMVAMLKSQGAGDDLVRAVEWPEVANWTDDGKGTVATRYGTEGDGPMFSLETKV